MRVDLSDGRLSWAAPEQRKLRMSWARLPNAPLPRTAYPCDMVMEQTLDVIND